MDKVYEAQAVSRQAEVVTAEPVVANEHMREVRAPPGPLGVSFDANDTSHRVIGVRPASPLARHVAVGDRLVRISTPGRAPLMCGPTVTGLDITDELRAGASSGGRVLSFAGYPLIPSAEIGGCYTCGHVGVVRWCSPCEGHVWGAYLGMIPPFVWPLLCYFRDAQTKNPNYYCGLPADEASVFSAFASRGDSSSNHPYILVKDRDTLGFGQVCCYAPSEPECCECRRCGSGQA